MNRVPQKSAKWETQWIRKKECNKLLSPKARSMFDLLQSVLGPILPHQQDAPMATLTNETLWIEHITDENIYEVLHYVNYIANNNLI